MSAELRSTLINGVFEVWSQPFVDARGAFLNLYRSHEDCYNNSWKNREIIQVNLSRNEVIGTIRGLHLQAEPNSEAKLVRCLRGRVWDVVVDLRLNSPTYSDWLAIELCAEKANAILIPEGCAHGFQVLEKESELLYLHSCAWVPESEIGIRWDDPQIGIPWPLPVTYLSDRDRTLPLLAEL